MLSDPPETDDTNWVGISHCDLGGENQLAVPGTSVGLDGVSFESLVH